MIDAIALSGRLAATLIPALPYLLAKVDAGAIAQAGQKLGADAWKAAQGIWGALEPKIQTSPAAQQITAQVAEDPSQPGAEAALGFQLQALLKADPGLAAELTRILESSAHAGASTTVTASGERSVALGGDVSGSTINTGDRRYGDDIRVGNISGSQGIAMGRGAQATVHGNLISSSGAVDAQALRAALEGLYAALGQAELPLQAKLTTQTAAGNAVIEGVKDNEVKPEAVVPRVKEIGDAIKQANVAVKEGSALWESVRTLATTAGPLVQGGAQAVAGWFGVPLPI